MASLWKSLPEELQRRIVAMIPAVTDAGRLGLTGHSCFVLVEEEMRDRCLSMMRERWTTGSVKITGDMVSEDPSLPDGRLSWVRLLASRLGILPSDALITALACEEAELDEYGDREEFYVTSGGGSDDARTIESFEDLGCDDGLIRGIRDYGLGTPSLIQRHAVLPLTAMQDVLVQASSGTGKTVAYAIGLLHNIDSSIEDSQAIVLVPTRELGAGVYQVHRSLGKYLGVKTGTCIALPSVRAEIIAIRGGVHLVVGTPGRVVDMLERGCLNPWHVRQLVVDEADEMLSRGFCELIYRVVQSLPFAVRIGIFYVTPNPDVLKLASNVLPRMAPRDALSPIFLRLHRRDDLVLGGVHQFYIAVEQEDRKLETLQEVLELADVASKIIVYVNSCRKADRLAETLLGHGIACLRLSSKEDGIRNTPRLIILDDLNTRQMRGGVHEIASLVVNYDLPLNSENYLHRVGHRVRQTVTRRVAVSFVTPEAVSRLREIEHDYNTAIEEMPTSIKEFTI